MTFLIYGIVAAIFIIRLLFLKISKQNEKTILENGGREYGAENSKRLTILHILFYLSCVIEAILRKSSFDTVSLIGLGLILFSMCMLYTVVNLLRGIWTVKLMIVKNHKFNNHWLFRTIKHPNYFLNIAPELLGLTLLCHAWTSAILILPLYTYVLFVRIREEERLIQEIILPNGIQEC
ncbi:MAG: isoprenylcysteine carboxyl methyltransferase family protein [Peptostreptococcaceae bacterium]|nr:isoprenylcysteine carboxyl methyltransferase family protein [Peptostreptococcaceae bacterium]